MEFLGISGPEAIIIAVVVLVVLGPKGMSEAARRILEVRRRWLEVSASFRKQSDQASTPQAHQNTGQEVHTSEESSTTGRGADS